MDAGVGVLTLWFAEDIFGTEAKRRLRRIENFLEQQNKEMEEILEKLRRGETVEGEEGRLGTREGEEGPVPISGLAKLIPLRRTGYMNLDIQIPNPFTPDSEFDDDEMGEYSAQPTPRDTGAPTSPRDGIPS